MAATMLIVAFSGQAGAATPGPVQAIAAGDQHALAIGNVSNGSGLVWAWGANWNGQVGDNTHLNNRFPPAGVVGPTGGYFTGAQAIEAGRAFSLAVRNDGTLWAWGQGASGQLGVHSDNDHDSPQQVHGPGNVGYLSGVKSVAAGANFSLALKDDGTVWAWGNNHAGQLGINSNNNHTVPYQVHGPGNTGYLGGITAVAAGDDHSLALSSDGTVWAWGDNNAFELGTGTMYGQYTPVKVLRDAGSSFTGVVAIAAGDHFSLALRNDGTVWAWGWNNLGQLGLGDHVLVTYPTEVHGPGNVGYLSGIKSVAAGGYHSLALTSDGTVYAWGRNNNGQLGIHSDNEKDYPVQVHGLGNVGYLSDITSVAAGEYFSMALNSAGTAVYAWGGNSYGQIDATGEDHHYPAQVTGVPGSITSGAPVLANVTLSATSFFLGSKLPVMSRAKAPVGTNIGFTLNRPARVQFLFTYRTIGRRINGRCVAPTNANRGRARCLRTVRAAFSRQAHAGRTRLHFEGRLDRKRKLPPGRYKLIITATANGHHSKPVILRFTILR